MDIENAFEAHKTMWEMLGELIPLDYILVLFVVVGLVLVYYEWEEVEE